VKFEIFELSLSGDKARIYSVMVENETDTLYEKFVLENIVGHKKEVSNIDDRLYLVGHETGLFAEFFDTKAGQYGENLCTFKDRPGSKLRLFFIEYGFAAIILGSGGVKPKTSRSTQDVPGLFRENRLLGQISITLQKAEKAGHFKVNRNGSIMSTTNYIYNTADYG